MPAEPHGAAEIGPTPVSGPASGRSGWFGRNGARCARTATGPTPGPATAVRDAERLVQVQVRHVGAELPGLRDADERVEVRAVEVHLPAVLVDERAHVADVRLEHAVRRRVGDHERRRARRRARAPSPSGRRGRRCRRRRTRPPRRAGPPSPRWPRSCRAPTRGSGRRRGADSPRSAWYARIASRPASSPCEPALGCSDTAS